MRCMSINPLYINEFLHLVCQKKIVLFCLKINFTFTNSVDPDEMLQYAAFHLGVLLGLNIFISTW